MALSEYTTAISSFTETCFSTWNLAQMVSCNTWKSLPESIQYKVWYKETSLQSCLPAFKRLPERGWPLKCWAVTYILLSNHGQIIIYSQPSDCNDVLFKDEFCKSQSHILCVVQAQLILDQKGNGCIHEGNVTNLNDLNTQEDVWRNVYIRVHTWRSTEYLFTHVFFAWIQHRTWQGRYLLWEPDFREDQKHIHQHKDQYAVLSHYKSLYGKRKNQ